MKLLPSINILPQKKFIGIRLKMSLAENKTTQLWQSFMPERSRIKHMAGAALYSIEKYEPNYFKVFDPITKFEKWAAVEVSNYEEIPGNMETLTIPEGLYAVFTYKGPSSEVAKLYQYIFIEWLPGSGYKLDQRPHFAIMGEKYSNIRSDSEEDICIPIQPQGFL